MPRSPGARSDRREGGVGDVDRRLVLGAHELGLVGHAGQDVACIVQRSGGLAGVEGVIRVPRVGLGLRGLGDCVQLLQNNVFKCLSCKRIGDRIRMSPRADNLLRNGFEQEDVKKTQG